MKISESIKILLEYKAVSDSDTNDEYRYRLANSINNPTLSRDQKHDYVEHLKKTHHNLEDQLNPDRSNQKSLDSSDYDLFTDRIKVAKHNNELFKNIEPEPVLKHIAKLIINHHPGMVLSSLAHKVFS